jgi:hypothetical protein
MILGKNSATKPHAQLKGGGQYTDKEKKEKVRLGELKNHGLQTKSSQAVFQQSNQVSGAECRIRVGGVNIQVQAGEVGWIALRWISSGQ